MRRKYETSPSSMLCRNSRCRSSAFVPFDCTLSLSPRKLLPKSPHLQLSARRRGIVGRADCGEASAMVDEASGIYAGWSKLWMHCSKYYGGRGKCYGG